MKKVNNATTVKIVDPRTLQRTHVEVIDGLLDSEAYKSIPNDDDKHTFMIENFKRACEINLNWADAVETHTKHAEKQADAVETHTKHAEQPTTSRATTSGGTKSTTSGGTKSEISKIGSETIVRERKHDPDVLSTNVLGEIVNREFCLGTDVRVEITKSYVRFVKEKYKNSNYSRSVILSHKGGIKLSEAVYEIVEEFRRVERALERGFVCEIGRASCRERV